jgi:hypothetical protein
MECRRYCNSTTRETKTLPSTNPPITSEVVSQGARPTPWVLEIRTSSAKPQTSTFQEAFCYGDVSSIQFRPLSLFTQTKNPHNLTNPPPRHSTLTTFTRIRERTWPYPHRSPPAVEGWKTNGRASGGKRRTSSYRRGKIISGHRDAARRCPDILDTYVVDFCFFPEPGKLFWLALSVLHPTPPPHSTQLPVICAPSGMGKLASSQIYVPFAVQGTRTRSKAFLYCVQPATWTQPSPTSYIHAFYLILISSRTLSSSHSSLIIIS